ncbi:MAG: hypothetical protein FWC83_01000 [Alphaproteobacteria bacterium]|nr:hypothetical protein [Alphaproteobacteria bacterium]
MKKTSNIIKQTTGHWLLVTGYSRKAESGRTLIEMIAVLAIAATMVVAAFAAYQVVAQRQIRIIATEDLREIARNSRILFAGRPNFQGISVAHLIHIGALRNDNPPRIAQRMSIGAGTPSGFFINLYGMSYSNCTWISLQHFDFVDTVIVNDMMSGHPSEHCQSGHNNTATLWMI